MPPTIQMRTAAVLAPKQTQAHDLLTVSASTRPPYTKCNPNGLKVERAIFGPGVLLRRTCLSDLFILLCDT
jgi:hypothetical protein